MERRMQCFYYVSGRGWVTIAPLKCKACGQKLEGIGERQVTEAEYSAIVVPALDKDKSCKKIVLELREQQ